MCFLTKNCIISQGVWALLKTEVFTCRINQLKLQFHILKSTNIFENEIRRNHCEILEKIKISPYTEETKTKVSSYLHSEKSHVVTTVIWLEFDVFLEKIKISPYTEETKKTYATSAANRRSGCMIPRRF